MSDDKSDPLISVTGLWLSANGSGTMSGGVGGIRFVVAKNKKKVDGDKQPDYVLYIAQNQPRPQAEQQGQQPAPTTDAPPPTKQWGLPAKK